MDFTVLNAAISAADENLTLSEKLSHIVNTALVGYLLVFAVLAIIWGILEIFGRVLSKKSQKSNGALSGDTVLDSVSDSSVQNNTESGNEEEIVAAIAAAISSYTQKPLSSFRVVSFRKNNK